MLEAGDKAPDFKATDDQGKPLSLKDLRGKKVVLYFYPKDDTSGCTKEACDFQVNLAAIKKRGAIVIGISPDSEKSHQKFKNKYELSFPLVVDEDKSIAKAYDVWQEKSMYGRKYMGIVRTTFIIDEKGKIDKIFPKVKVNDHAKAVLEALTEL